MNKSELIAVMDMAISGDENQVMRMWQICKCIEDIAKEHGNSASEKEFYQLGNCWIVLSGEGVLPSIKDIMRKDIKNRTLSAVSDLLGW